MVELTLELLRSELDQALDKGLEPVRSELAFIRARVTMVGSAVDVLQRDFRMIKAALNDMAKTSVTSGVMLCTKSCNASCTGRTSLKRACSCWRSASRK